MIESGAGPVLPMTKSDPSTASSSSWSSNTTVRDENHVIIRRTSPANKTTTTTTMASEDNSSVNYCNRNAGRCDIGRNISSATSTSTSSNLPFSSSSSSPSSSYSLSPPTTTKRTTRTRIKKRRVLVTWFLQSCVCFITFGSLWIHIHVSTKIKTSSSSSSSSMDAPPSLATTTTTRRTTTASSIVENDLVMNQGSKTFGGATTKSKTVDDIVTKSSLVTTIREQPTINNKRPSFSKTTTTTTTSTRSDIQTTGIKKRRNNNNTVRIPRLTTTNDDNNLATIKRVNEPIMTLINPQQQLPNPVRVRILLFEADGTTQFSFRAPDTATDVFEKSSTISKEGGDKPTNHDINQTQATIPADHDVPWQQQISDELLNICLDGFSKSSYFGVIEPTIIPPMIMQQQPTSSSSSSSSANTTNDTTTTTTHDVIYPDYYLEESEPVVWVIDIRRLFVVKSLYVLDPIIQLVYNTRRWQLQQQQQQQQQRQESANRKKKELPPSIHIVLMDYRDKWSRTFCKFKSNFNWTDLVLTNSDDNGSDHSENDNNNNPPDSTTTLSPIELLRYLVGPNNVRHVRQQIVQQRKWDKSSNYISTGVVVPRSVSNVLDSCYGTTLPSSSSNENPYLHVPYTVRSDFVEAVQKTFHRYLPESQQQQQQHDHEVDDTTSEHSQSTTPSRGYPSDTYRPIDVSHLFDANSKEPRAELRKAVSRTLLDMEMSSSNHDHHGKNFTVVAQSVSVAAGVGRTSIQERYLETLLTSKIVVVAQRDEWEDHYRLFEAISCGPLVFTDFMYSLPDGYVDGKNIVVYKTLDELRTKVLYYTHPKNEHKRIQMAHAGWSLAMNYHRTFHWMERLFFGRAITNTSSTVV